MPSPSPMEILQMKVDAIKDVLQGKKPTEKKGFITRAMADDFNRLLEEAKKAEPQMAEHLPVPIKIGENGWGAIVVQQVDYIHFESMINRLIGTIRLFNKN